MQIEFTKEQYRDLLRAAYIAEWMTDIAESNGAKRDYGIVGLAQRIYAFAHSEGMNDLIHFDAETKEWFPTKAFDDEKSVRTLIDAYDDEVFWDELQRRLGERDLHRRPAAEILSMTPDDRDDALDECEEKWEKEFAAHGVDRIGIAS